MSENKKELKKFIQLVNQSDSEKANEILKKIVESKLKVRYDSEIQSIREKSKS